MTEPVIKLPVRIDSLRSEYAICRYRVVAGDTPIGFCVTGTQARKLTSMLNNYGRMREALELIRHIAGPVGSDRNWTDGALVDQIRAALEQAQIKEGE